jgi:hypothetical protein
VSHDAHFNLAVISCDQLIKAFTCDEAIANFAPFFGANRDVLQIGTY